MIRRLALVVGLAFCVAACSATPAPTTTAGAATPPLATANQVGSVPPAAQQATPVASDPYAGLPSAACGGVHVRITNDRDARIAVSINGTRQTTIDPHESATLIEMLVGLEMPWHLVITDLKTGATVYETTVDGPVGREIVVEDPIASATPQDTTGDGCLHDGS